MTALPHNLTNGSTLDASHLMDNYNALRNALDQVRNGNLARNAAISKLKLAERFTNPQHGVVLIPHTSTAVDLATLADFTLVGAVANLELHRERITLDAGQVASLCQVEFYLANVTVGGGGEYPTIEVLVDGVQLSGQVITMDTDGAYYSFGNASPVASPLVPVIDGSVIIYRLSKTGAGTPGLRGLSLTKRVLKLDLVA